MVAIGVAAPAGAAPIPPPQAIAEIEAAIAVTNAATTYRYVNNGSLGGEGAPGDRAVYNLPAGQYQQRTFGGEQRVFQALGNYHRIQWPSPKVRKKVRSARYLDRPKLQWEKGADASRYRDTYLGWADVEGGRRVGTLENVALDYYVTSADKQATATGTRYQLNGTQPAFEQTYDVDGAGRITRIDWTKDLDGLPVTDANEAWEYGEFTVKKPPGAATARIRLVRRAIQAATLNATLKAIALRTVRLARSERLSVAQMRPYARIFVTEDVNGIGDGDAEDPVARYVKIRLRPVPGGVRIFRTNPFTGTAHEWRVVKGKRWKAYRTAP